MSNPNRFTGKTALVTGAGVGIGREIALEFARQGANVVLHYNHANDRVTSVVDEILKMGRKASAIRADFAQLPAVTKLAEEVEAAFGGIDCLVNNAGITFNKPFAEVTPAQFDRMFHVNLRAQFFLTQRLVGGMIRRNSGSICNITSIHGMQGASEHALYAATKAAIIGYTRALAIEVAHHGVRINALAPGWIMVESHAKAVPDFNDDNAKERAKNKVPAGRYGTPQDVAKLATFLCSEDADFIVGQTFVVDGGTTALMSLLSDFRAKSAARFGADYLSDL